MKQIESFIENLTESLKELAETLKQAREAIQRFVIIIDTPNSGRKFPPYKEKLTPREYSRHIYWHRIRSNPHRKRKPH